MVIVKSHGHCVQRMFGDPLLRHVVAVSVCTFTVILPLTCFNVRHSVYSLWQTDRDREQTRLAAANTRRLQENLAHLRAFNATALCPDNTSDKQPKTWKHLHVAITIITVSRNRHRVEHYETQYLSQVVGRFLYLLNKTISDRTYRLFVCNVDQDPDSYGEMKALPASIPTFERYSQTEKPPKDIFEKEKQDYIFCMEESLKMNPSYVFLVEDDAYPHRHLLPVLEHVIDYHIERRNTIGARNFLHRIVTYVKFYHPERLLGYYSLEAERIPELVGASLVLGTGLFLFYMHFVVAWKPNKVNVTWALCIVYCCLVCVSIGRQNLLELRRLSTHLYQVTPAPSCCTPAMLYTKRGGEMVATHLKGVKCKQYFGKDKALEEIRRREKYVGLLVQPNVFEHIGMYSSVRQSMVDPFAV
ncbi:post-GPI attachment to proteins factor 4-like isoform X2 [Gigantopelta aegis]|nr:post-GPI attachment to proteins factor 4-like isoform X2 [Gigantopelta aegis]